MDKKNIFITGIAGFLGSYLADRFLEQGHRVIGCDNLIGGYIDNIPQGVEFHAIDCMDRYAMGRLLRDVEIVYHCAAYAHEGLSVFAPHIITQNTYGITTSVLSAAIANKVSRFIFCSSMARYGMQAEIPFREEMLPLPQDPYGIAKYAAEITIQNLSSVHGIEYVIAVPHNIIGPRQRYDDPFRNVAGIMINLMLQGRQPIVYGDGEQKRCFSFIKDVVTPLERMVNDSAVVGEVINVGPDEEFITINQLVATIAELLDFPLKPVYMPGRPQEVQHATCSADKARRLLGYKTTTSLREGLREMITYVRKRGVKPFRYHIDLEIISDLTPKAWRDRLF